MNVRTSVAAALAVILAAGPCLAQEQSTQGPAAATAKPAKPISERDRSKGEKLYLKGVKALEDHNPGDAESYFEKASALVPDNDRYRALVGIARQHRASELVQSAEKERILGQSEKARADLLLAYQLDPKNTIVTQHLDELAHDNDIDTEKLYPGPEMAASAIQLAPAKRTQSFHLHTGSQDLIRRVLTSYGLSVSIDSSVHNQSVRFDADDVDYSQAAKMLKLVTNTFIVPLDPSRVLVAEDTKDNREHFQRLVYETVYLPGLTPAEMTDVSNLAKNLFDATQAVVSVSGSSLLVRAPEDRMRALNLTLKDLLSGHSQVQLDVKLYSLAKTRTLNIGIQPPSQTTVFNVPTELNSVLSSNQSLVQEIISSGLASAGDDTAIAAILIASGALTGTVFNTPFALFGGGDTLSGLGIGSITGNLALNSSDTRALDDIKVNVENQDEATIRSGTRYPIETSSYSSLSGSSVSIPGLSTAGISSSLASLGISSAALASTNETIPQVQYQDLGLTLKVKPYIERNQDVTLNIDLKITALQGTEINDIPVLTNQQYTAITTLKNGASAMVVSAMSKSQSAAVNGLPGLSELPGFQSTTNQQSENDVSNLLIVITPHITHIAHPQEVGNMMIFPTHP
ncbi:hypothetical protein [Silvibacterium acidisoli]|uniref:hypothetical protein n=1 Tax=Acidobacteriaceae bacterium ZG23-2 TaxID=2883246 RepID=UPI00406CAAD6